MKRKIIAMVLAALLIIGLTACKSDDEGKSYSNVSVNDILNSIKPEVSTITEIEIATEKTDSNNLLGKQGEYIDLGWFIDSRTEKDGTPSELATSGGGAIEKFGSVADATKRNTYLQSFTGFLANHSVQHGVFVIRISSDLTASQQNELVEIIISEIDKIK